MYGGLKMTTSDMIRELCEKVNISISEIARRIGQSPQNFNKKLQRGTVSVEEMIAIADVLGILFEQGFTLPDGKSIKIYSNKYGGRMDEKRITSICTSCGRIYAAKKEWHI